MAGMLLLADVASAQRSPQPERTANDGPVDCSPALLPETRWPKRPLTAQECAASPDCARARANYENASHRHAAAAKTLEAEQADFQRFLAGELSTPTLKRSVADLARVIAQVEEVAGKADGSISDASTADPLTAKLVKELKAAQAAKQADLANLVQALENASAAGLSFSAGSYLETSLKIYRELVGHLEKAQAAADNSLPRLGTLMTEYAPHAKRLAARKEAVAAAQKCVDNTRKAALVAGWTPPPSPATITIEDAEFGVAGTALICKAVQEIKRQCDKDRTWRMRDGSKVKGAFPADRKTDVVGQGCDIPVYRHCDDASLPGTFANRKLAIRWSCSADPRAYCGVWGMGETVSIICDGNSQYVCGARR